MITCSSRILSAITMTGRRGIVRVILTERVRSVGSIIDSAPDTLERTSIGSNASPPFLA